MHQSRYIAASVWVALLLTPHGVAQEPDGTQTPRYELDIRSFGAACDGSDDARAVQAAIDALPSGASLLVSCRAGIGSAGLLLRDRKGVIVRGTGGGGFYALARTPSGVLLRVVNCNECTIADLAIEGGNVGVAALGIERCTGTTVRDNTLTNIGFPAQAAIVAFGNRNNRYTGNVVVNTGVRYKWDGEMDDATRGIWIGNEKPEFYDWNPVIAGNRLRNIGGTAIVAHAYSAVIEDNVGENLLWSGAKVVSPAGSSGTTRVAGNTFRGAGGRYSGGNIQLGSEMGNGETIIVENNTIEGDRDSGIYAARGPVRGRFVNNTIRNTLEAGITVVTSAADLTIRGNRILNATPGKHYQGIRLLAWHGMAIRNVEIAENEIQGQTENGILLQTEGGTIEGVRIHSNSLAKVGWYGVYIDEKTTRNAIRNVEVGANCFIENRMGALSDNRGWMVRQPASVCPPPAPAER